MLPATFVLWIVTGIIEVQLVFPKLGLSEGSLLLMAHSAAGWAYQMLFFAIVIAAPIAGVWLAAKAIKLGSRWAARSAIIANALVIALLAYNLFDIIRMSYWPQW
jgi:hypothetical protein